jgi:HEAT repeat protein
MGQAARPAAAHLGKALQDPNGDVRRNAALAMNSIGVKAGGNDPGCCGDGDGGVGTVTVRLVGALSDSSYKVRRNAVQALGKLGVGAGPATIAPLVVALSDDHVDVRKRSADALGLVLSGLRGNAVAAVDGAAAASLEDVSVEETGLSGLARALSSDPNDDVRRLAALALSRVGGCVGGGGLPSASLDVLKVASEADHCPKVRGLARQVRKALHID